MTTPGIIHPYAEAFSEGLDRDDIVVLIHGWTGSPSHFRPIADLLTAAGLGVIAPRLAGHGTQVEHMVDTGWRDWLASAAGAATMAGERGGRVHFAGLSMGGLLSLLIANGFSATSVTTINSPIVVHSWRLRFAFLKRGSREIEHYPPDDWPDGFATEYAHQYDSTPVGTGADLYELIKAAKRHLPLVGAPGLVIQSKTDETVRSDSGRYIYDHLGSVTKKLVWLQRSRHVATLDSERDTIADEIIEHVASAVRIASGRTS